MAKMGRPTLLNKHLKELAVTLAKQPDMTLAKLAASLNIGRTTLYLYLQKDKDFLNAVQAGLDMADELVAISMFRRAIGYSHPEEKIFYDSERGKAVRVKTIKHYPPSEQAGTFWLKNRQPDKWREKVEPDDADTDKPIKLDYADKDL